MGKVSCQASCHPPFDSWDLSNLRGRNGCVLRLAIAMTGARKEEFVAARLRGGGVTPGSEIPGSLQ